MSTLKLGIAQLHPAWGNKAATTKIVIEAIAQAAGQGIELLAFSETFLSGYPFWVCRTAGATRQGRCPPATRLRPVPGSGGGNWGAGDTGDPAGCG